VHSTTRPGPRRVLFHAVPVHRLASILANGLLPSCSRGKLPAVWVASPSKRAYIRQHVSRRHRVPADQIVLVRVLVDRQQLRRSDL
jgi:hypothetical protein